MIFETNSYKLISKIKLQSSPIVSKSKERCDVSVKKKATGNVAPIAKFVFYEIRGTATGNNGSFMQR